ncbi:MAG TPA: adenylate/guanylate cyclase domain-containing protein [Candidatus Ozemobacteraceae bacterium]|nr:adenylate/guanylate cyclase domain-containing protein [Candidatus Ozemobacteraceae bacterium]
MIEQKSSFARRATFFNTILLPFILISIFAEFYSNSFLMAFLVDNSKAVQIARESGEANSSIIQRAIVDRRMFSTDPQGKIEVSQKNDEVKLRIKGEFYTAGIRLLSILLLYFWLRPLFAFLRKGDESLRPLAEKRYNNFYRAIFSYFFFAHLVWFISSTFKTLHPHYPEGFSVAVGYHLFWWVIECYLFYLFLEPSLFLYVSGLFARNGQPAGRSSLSIYMKLVSMMIFLVLLPMAILAACIHKDYFYLAEYKMNGLILIVTSAAFLIGNLQLLFKSIQQPLDVLGDKMQRLAEGDFAIQTSVFFDDEIGRLKLNFNRMVDQLKEREELKDTFGKYVSIEIARHLIENRKVSLGGENIAATVLFSDIRNFTTMSEQMSPEEVVSMLNSYFSYITEPVMENHGVINKFIGDAVMAIFTPHLGSDNHVEDAINAALGMRQRLAELNASGRLKMPVRFGVGLNTGNLVAGNIGTEKRFEYTVIGDTVNVASRMESLSKSFDHDIILSQATVDQIPSGFAARLQLEKTDPVQIKGKSQPASVYKLLGRA